MVRVFSRPWDVQPVERDRGGRRERVVCLTQPVRACDCHAAHLGVHARGETEERRELRAHLQPWNVCDRVHDGERRAGVIHDLMREKPGEVRVVLAAAGWLGGLASDPLEEKDQGMDGLKLGEYF